MAANDNIVVRIVGDASQVAPAVEMTGTSLQSLEPLLAELNSQIAALTAQMKESFTAGAASAKQLAGGLEEAKVAAAGAGSSIGEMSERLHMGGLSVGIFEKAFAPLVEIVAAAFAVDRIGEFITKMGEAAEKVVHLGQQFGMSIAEVQQLQGVAAATGISVDSLTRGMGVFDRNLATVATGSRTLKQAFDQVGVSINDGRSQMEKLEVVADKFKDMDDGPKKAALAMQLFGRSGRELIPVLNLGRDGIEQLNQKMADYGVVNEAAIESGEKLAENINETKLGFEGVENVLMQALAPAFTEIVAGVNKLIEAFVQSYQQGGIVADIFAVISLAIRDAVVVVEALGQIFAAIWSIISEVVSDIGSVIADVFGVKVPKNFSMATFFLNEFKDAITILKDAILVFVDFAGGAFRTLEVLVATFAEVANDALHLKWSSIEGDWNAGMSRIANIVHEYAGKIEADAAEMGKAIAAAASGQALPGSPDTGLKLPKAGGDFDYNPSAKGKKAKDDLVQRLEEELEEKKAAFEKEQLLQGTAQQYSLQSEADFWAQALARTDLSSKDKLAIEQKWIAAAQGVQKEEIAKKLDGYKDDLAAAGNNWTQKKAILEQEQVYVIGMYGAQSKEAADAAKAVIDAKREEAKQIQQINDDIFKTERQLRLIDVDEAEADAKQRVEMGLETKGQLLAQEKSFEDQRYQIHLQELEKEKALIDPNRDPVAYQKICDQIEILERQHQQKLTEIDRQAVLQRTQIERNAINSVSQSWAQQIAQLATLQQGFFTTLKGLYQGLQQAAAQALEAILEKFIATEITKLIYGKTTAEAQIAAEAAKAGAGGVASMAAAPWPLDMTAPAFGASMAATALGFQSINIAERGDLDVTSGLYMLHDRETVLPAWAGQGLRDLLGGRGPANSNAPSAANDGGGDTHFHLYGNFWVHPRQMVKAAEQARHLFGAGVKAYALGGGSADPYR